MAEQALERLRRGLKLASDREKPYLLMGRLCKAIGRARVAETLWIRAVEIQPDSVEVSELACALDRAPQEIRQDLDWLAQTGLTRQVDYTINFSGLVYYGLWLAEGEPLPA